VEAVGLRQRTRGIDIFRAVDEDRLDIPWAGIAEVVGAIDANAKVGEVLVDDAEVVIASLGPQGVWGCWWCNLNAITRWLSARDNRWLSQNERCQ